MPTPRRVAAAVIRRRGGPFRIESLRLDAPRADEAVVRIVATGMCHTDLLIRDDPGPGPIVLGHEGAGVVERVGAEVDKVRRGDHVVLSFLSCGRCRFCLSGRPANCDGPGIDNFSGTRPDGTTSLHDGRSPVRGRFFAQSSFATYAIAHQRNMVKVSKRVPLELLGPLGCGIQTGAGAVMNSLGVSTGASLAVFGAGAVGLAAILAARIVGATTIIAVDIVPSRLVLARELGATHAIDSRKGDPAESVREIAENGVDYALDTTGRPEVIRKAVEALGVRGTCGILGASPEGAKLNADIGDILGGAKRILGIIEGDSVPEIFIPRLIELYRQGRFPFDRLIRFYRLDEINQAAKDSEAGMTIKPVLRMAADRAADRPPSRRRR